MQVGRGQVYQAKGTYQACLGQQQDESIPTPEKFIKRTSQNPVTYALQVFSPHHYLQALPSEQPLGARKANGNHIPRTGKG